MTQTQPGSGAGAWLAHSVACVLCGGGVRVGDGGGRGDAVACIDDDCGALYPLLAGVPVLVEDPGFWCAAYRDSILAAFAEHGAITPRLLRIVDAFAEGFAARAGAAERRLFADDWTVRESEGAGADDPNAGGVIDAGDTTGTADTGGVDAAGGVNVIAAFRRLVRAAASESPSAVIGRAIAAGGPVPVAVEIGPGAGALTDELAQVASQLLVVDLAPRPVLRALRRVDAAATAGVIMDGARLALAPDSADLIVAANVIDLVDDPAAFARGVADALRAGGRAILSTPDPGLGTGDEAYVLDVVQAAGLRVVEHARDVPWIRWHGPRHSQLYVCDVVTLAHT